jgi:hypothetical protein
MKLHLQRYVVSLHLVLMLSHMLSAATAAAVHSHMLSAATAAAVHSCAQLLLLGCIVHLHLFVHPVPYHRPH